MEHGGIMTIHNARDNSFKMIFGDHRLFSEFLKDFINIEILKDIEPEDIEDISERFIPLFQNNRDSDTVKRINLKDTPLFVIAILEHESKVNHRSSFKMLQYICLVLNTWEKEADRENPGTSLKKDFKYPPVLPIIFYDGNDNWSAERNFFHRTSLNTVFEKYIPKFEYELVNLNDYSEEMIMGFSDTLSIILLIDKIRDGRKGNLLRYLPPDYMEKINLQIPENLRKLLSDVIRVLLEKSGVNRLDAEKYADYVETADRKEHSGMFEAVIESIIEGREEARNEGREEGIETAARRALEEGATLEFVQKITGLDMETINGIANSRQ
jgi:predicted transposase/invertase (TIGR01784 family)